MFMAEANPQNAEKDIEQRRMLVTVMDPARVRARLIKRIAEHGIGIVRQQEIVDVHAQINVVAPDEAA
ncbi:MAG: hypothetical protein JWO87_1924 [Phycisphaerales bacterium]|nr:hypothetical protein [Phycisphaerales bacterium]